MATDPSSHGGVKEAGNAIEDTIPQTQTEGLPSEIGQTTPNHTFHEHTQKETTPESEKEKNSSRTDHLDSEDLEAARSSSTEEEKNEEKEKDPNVVDWDGPDDPANPMNWSAKRKWGGLIVISIMSIVTPLASSMFAPAVPQLMADFNSNNQELSSFVVSVYILGFTLGPLIVAPLSELYGRLWCYHVSNASFIIFTICCGVSQNIGMFIVFRFLQGCAGVTPITIGGGSIADVIEPQRRGAAMAIWAMGPLMGPVIGPIAGGFLNEAKGWRWIFWVITMLAGAVSINALILLRETYAPVLLERKTKRLRKETGNQDLISKQDPGIPAKEYLRRSIVRPTKLLFLSPIVFLLTLDMSIIYGYLYLIFTTLTFVFEGDYGFSSGTSGLSFLGIGVGMFIGLVLIGIASDKIVKKKTEAAGGVMKPEYRLPPLFVGGFFLPVGMFWYGWSAQEHAAWIVPIIGTSFMGLGIISSFMPINNYLIDTFGRYAASAIAANTVMRSLFGAVLPLAGQKMYATLGLGWGNSLLGFIAIALIPVPYLFMRYGERIRTHPKFQVNL